MKISPVSQASTVSSGASASPPSIRSITMNTDRTPGAALPPPEDELSKSPDIEDKDKATVEATQPISPQFAALAKQRRALQQERRAFEDERKAHEIAKQGSDAIPLADFKADPLGVMLAQGITYDQLTQALLNNQANPEVNSLKSEFNAFKEGIEKKFTEREEQAIQQNLASMQGKADSLIAQGDDFELIRATGNNHKVTELIEQKYRREGKILDITDACKMIENWLLKEQQKLATSKKMQSLFNKQEEQIPMQPQQRAQGMTTLTNKHTASMPMTARDRALAAFWGAKK